MNRRLSFNEICDQIPTIKYAFTLARSLDRYAPTTCIWYRTLKPLVAFHIGWARSEHRQEAERLAAAGETESRRFTTGAEILNSEYKPGLILEQAPMTLNSYQNRWLETSEAYDLVYQEIYSAMPGCKREYRL